MTNNSSAYILTIVEAAATIGISVYRLEWWCEWHDAYLSPGANPGTGLVRCLTGIDIEVLQYVKALRSEGLHTFVINNQLADLTLTQIDSSDVQPNSTADDIVIPG